MIPLENTDPYIFVPNGRTGRLEIYRDEKGKEVLVGSAPGNATDHEIRAMRNRLIAEGK